MKQFKQFFVLILMTLFSVSVWGATEYELMLTLDVTTGAPGGSTSTALNDATLLEYLQGAASAATDITAASKTGDVYKGKGSGGGSIPQACLKIGKASGGGTISFSIANTYDDVTKVEVTGYGWKTSTAVSVNSSATQSPAVAQSQVYTFSYELASGTKSIEIAVTSSAFCATEIKLYKTKSGGTPTPSLSADPIIIDFGTVDKDAVVSDKTVAVTFANLTGSVTYSGLSSPFSASGTIASTGDEITISANTETAGDYSRTLTIQSAADSKSVDVTVKMKVVAPLTPIVGGIVDELYILDFEVTGGYTAFTDKQASNTGHSDAVYAGTVARNGNSTQYNIQLNSGQTSSKQREIATSTSGGYVRRVQAIWATQTANTAGRKLTVYGSESAYNGSEAAASGTSLGELTYAVGDAYAYIDIASDYPYIQIVANGAIYMDQINVTWVSSAATVAKPVISGNESFLTSTDVTLTCATAGATIYYTTDGTDPKTSATKQSGTAFTLTNTATVRAIANLGSDWSAEATSKTFTKITPIDVATAISLIPNVDDVVDNQYVSGIVCTAGTSVSSGKMTYYISDDGSETSRLQIYKGKNLNNTNFTNVSDLALGDRVVVFGQLKNYSGTPEMNDGNYLVVKESAAVAAPVFDPNGGGFMGETDVTITCGTAGSAIYYTTDGTTPSKSSTAYSAAIHINATTTITAIAYVGDDHSIVVAKTFTYTSPMTVAEALAALDSEDPINNAAVSGIVSTAPASNPSSGKLTYYISDDGTATDELEVFNGYGLNGASFSAKTDLQVGDEVTVFGNLTIYNSTTKEFSAGSRLLTFNRPTVAVTSVELDQTAASIEEGENVSLTATVKPDNATDKSVVWTVESGDTYASVDNGVVTGIAAGTAVIRATSSADATKYAECTVTVTAADPTVHHVTFDATVDKTSENTELTLTKGDITIAITAGDGRFNNSTDYRIYKNAVFTVSGANSFITKIEFTCTGSNPISGFADAIGLDKENNKWTGNVNSVSFTASNKQVQITQLIITYKDDTRAASGLAWSTDAIEIDLGETFTPASLVNPNGIDAAEIAIESNNTDLATVTAGVVSLEPDVLGTAMITATFAGNASYKPATFSYTITVTDPTPVISTTPASLNWGTVNKDAAAETKTILVSLHNVAAATATLGGTNPTAFSIDKTSLVDGDVITVSVASTATEGTFPAKLIITDNAGVAADKEVSLSLKIEEAETPVSTSSKWVAATEIVDGMEVLITGVKDEETYAMGGQNNNNRAAVAGSLEAGIFTPGENTMAFTVVAQEGGTYALQTSNGNYLYAASNTNNYLRSKAELDDNGKWTLTIASAVANGTNTHNIMQFNGGSALFSCYNAESQAPIALYVRTKLLATVTAADMEVVAGASKAIAFTTNNTENPDVTYVVESGSENICLFKGAITGVKAGTATVRVTIAETENYTSASDEFEVTVTAPTAPGQLIGKVGGKFIINTHGDTAIFSRGNLRYNVVTEQWYCANKQYDFVGENGNLHFGDANYKGEFDLFGWSCASSNYGLRASNHDEDFTGDFIDWGGLFPGDEWSSLTKDEMNYIIAHHQWTTLILDPTPADADNEDEIVGLALFPLGWAQPAGFESLHYSLCDWNEEAKFADNTFALTAWDDLEAAGAVFLPMAGARAGHWGNNWNGSAVDPRKNPNPNGGNSYCFVDNIRWYGYYWLSTPHPTSVKSASYLIFPGWSEGPTTADDDDLYLPPVVWSREKRRGNSVRLVTRIPREPDYVRTEMLGNGVLGTVCVDHNVAINDAYGATFYELVGREAGQGKIVFDEIVSGQLEAGVPYLFQSTGEDLVLYYGTTKVDNPVNTGNGMYGTFSAITLTDLNDVYYFAQKALWGCSDLTSLSVPANRAYVKLSEVNTLSDPNPAPGRRRITMNVNGEQIATGLWDVDGTENAPRKVLLEGTLYILRGEKVYDTTGRLVK